MSVKRNKVSIIIPCYNQSRYLGEAIESAQNQEYKNIEIIVVDDGSTDNTHGVTHKYDGIQYFYQHNGGQASARNLGFSQSEGEYIVFLDSDDKLKPTSIDLGLRVLKDKPETAFVYGNVELISSNGMRLKNQDTGKIVKDNHYRELLKSNYLWTTGVAIFNRDVLFKTKVFDTNFKGANDWELFLRIAREYPIYCHGEVVLEYRLHDNNFTKNYSTMLKYSYLAIRSQKKYVSKNKELKTAFHEGITRLRRYYGDPLIKETKESFRNKSYKKVLTNLFTLIRYYPKGVKKIFT